MSVSFTHSISLADFPLNDLQMQLLNYVLHWQIVWGEIVRLLQHTPKLIEAVASAWIEALTNIFGGPYSSTEYCN